MKKYILFIITIFSSFTTYAQCVDNGNYWNKSWVSCTTSTNPNPTRGNSHWLLYEFHEPQYITSSHIWNANRTGESGWGAKDIVIDYFMEGNWIELGQYTLPQAPENNTYGGELGPDFGGVFLEKILITILSTHDGGTCASIAEMKFDIDPTACYGIIDACGLCNGPGEPIWYLDADGDGWGDPNSSLSDCFQPNSYVANSADDCDNGNLGWATIGPLLADNGCTNCHGAGNSGGLDLRSYATATAGGYTCGTDILTGTKWVDIITTSGINPCGTPIAVPSMNDRVGGLFDEEELAILQLWIDGGAPELCENFCLNGPAEIPYNGLDDDCDPLTLDDDLDQDGFISAIDCNDQDPSVGNISGNIYVDINASGTNDGSTWRDAFTDLQDALAIGANKYIHIAEGTYLPTNTSTRGIYFTVPNNCQLIGGYPPGGGTRNTQNHLTILSGDVDGVAGNDANSFHVVSVVNVDCITLDGLVIRDGGANNANSFARARGAGLYINNSSKVTIINCKVENNTALYGGGMFAYLSTVDILNSEFSTNIADYGSAIYHSNETQLFVDKTRIINNISNVRCAIEVNNSLFTRIENSVIANNISTNANAIGLIATNRDQTFEVFNSTILGEAKNRSLVTMQIGFGDQLDATFHNSIIAHQDLSYTKAFVIYNNNILSLNTENCYIQGSSVFGNAVNNLYSATAGDLLLSADYSTDPCSPVVDAGNNNLAVGATDIAGNLRIQNTVDIGAYEAQTSCNNPPSKMAASYSKINIYPNPTSGLLNLVSDMEDLTIEIYDILGNQLLITRDRKFDLRAYPSGVYIFHIKKDNELITTEKVIKQK